MATLKLLTNVALTGRLSGVWYAKTKNPEYSDQIKLNGTWEGNDSYAAGIASVYLPLPMENELRSLGIIEAIQGKLDKDGGQAYRVLNPGPVTLLRKEEGTRKITTISLSGAMAVPAPHTNGQPPKMKATDRGYWLALRETYRACLKIAESEWGMLLTTEAPPEVIQSATATLFIQACRDGQLVIPKADDANASL